MNIYRILVENCGPKSQWINTKCFLLAEDELEVYNYIDKELADDAWTERDDEHDLIDIYDEDFEVIGQETYKEKLLRLKGEIDDEDKSYDDAHYGLTFYAWELVEFSDMDDAERVLEEAGMLRKV